MTETVTELLAYDRVKAWLESKPPRAPVGRPARSFECPLACYLREQGVIDPSVAPDQIHWTNPRPGDDHHRERAAAPDWVRPFVYLVDRSTGYRVLAQGALTKLLSKGVVDAANTAE